MQKSMMENISHRKVGHPDEEFSEIVKTEWQWPCRVILNDIGEGILFPKNVGGFKYVHLHIKGKDDP